MSSFPAYVVRQAASADAITAQVEDVAASALPPGEVLIRVQNSSLNYKDALASQGHPGVVRSFPHIPGIDAAGVVEACETGKFRPGDEVIVTGYELGAGHWGGFAGYIRVPAAWVVPRPPGLSLKQCMVYGTAGFTAAQAALAIQKCEIASTAGPVVVTGASGGVGSIAVGILARLGYEVVAISGKAEASDFLRGLGASKVMGRREVGDSTNRPLLSARWAAAVDTVGGDILSTVIRQMEHRGCVAACGLVAGEALNLTVYPFILRGVTLAGIDSAKCPMSRRVEIWARLASDWKLPNLDHLARTITLRELPEKIIAIRKGEVMGRTVIDLTDKNN